MASCHVVCFGCFVLVVCKLGRVGVGYGLGGMQARKRQNTRGTPRTSSGVKSLWMVKSFLNSSTDGPVEVCFGGGLGGMMSPKAPGAPDGPIFE